MNSLKTLFIIAVLGAGAYGLHLSLSRPPESSETSDAGLPGAVTPQVYTPNPGTTIPPYTAPDLSLSIPTGPKLGTADPSGANLGTASQTLLQTPVSPAETTPEGMATSYVSGDRVAPPHVLAPPPNGTAEANDPFARSAPITGQNFSSDEFLLLMQIVGGFLEKGQLAEAHVKLSDLYGNPMVPPERVQDVISLLDQLAGAVVYSRQHLLEPAYRVKPGDTLEGIATAYQVSPQLLARINGVGDPLTPGQALKVVRGPFEALVDLEKFELTLMLGKCYAGRFPIGVGRDQLRLEGIYSVRRKVVDPAYHGPDVSIAPNDPNNPLGEYFIDLGNQIGIHGTNDPQNLHTTTGRGTICLSDQDIEDVFGILSVGSRVVIHR